MNGYILEILEDKFTIQSLDAPQQYPLYKTGTDTYKLRLGTLVSFEEANDYKDNGQEMAVNVIIPYYSELPQCDSIIDLTFAQNQITLRGNYQTDNLYFVFTKIKDSILVNCITSNMDGEIVITNEMIPQGVFYPNFGAIEITVYEDIEAQTLVQYHVIDGADNFYYDKVLVQ